MLFVFAVLVGAAATVVAQAKSVAAANAADAAQEAS
jgi:hypothetical protein